MGAGEGDHQDIRLAICIAILKSMIYYALKEIFQPKLIISSFTYAIKLYEEISNIVFHAITLDGDWNFQA